MKTIMVRYQTTEAGAETNTKLVRAVFDALRARAPANFRYATYRDGPTFVHVATLTSEPHPLTTLPEFKAFQKDLKDRCAEPPVITELTMVDSYTPNQNGA